MKGKAATMYFTTIAPLAMGLVSILLSINATAGQAAETTKLTLAKAPPPKQIAEEIQAVLEPTVIQLAEKGGPFFEFWFRKEIPLAQVPPADSFALTTVKEGTLLGALRVYRERFDFKDEEIPPGVYILRLGLQPEDGDHLGTSPTRTFALLIPAKDDRRLGSFSDHEKLVKASSTINAAEHPSNLNLQPIEEAGTRFPRLAAHNGAEQKVVCLRLPAKVEGRDESFLLTFALVYQGMGEF